MNSFDPDMKVANIIEQYPQTCEVFLNNGCPDMRKGFFSFMAQIMSIRNAARIHRIPLDELLNDLESVTEYAEPLVNNE